jgi:hypothetical protein
MQDDGVFPDIVSSICILKACEDTGSITTGEQIHAKIIERRLLEQMCCLALHGGNVCKVSYIEESGRSFQKASSKGCSYMGLHCYMGISKRVQVKKLSSASEKCKKEK